MQTSSNLVWRETNWCSLIGWVKFCHSDLPQMRLYTLQQGYLRLVCRCDKILSQQQRVSHVIRGDLLQQPVAAMCRSHLLHRVSRPVSITFFLLFKFALLLVHTHFLVNWPGCQIWNLRFFSLSFQRTVKHNMTRFLGTLKILTNKSSVFYMSTG